jgi:REP element-mobilizing transposase RayT
VTATRSPAAPTTTAGASKRKALKYAPVVFNGRQALAIIHGFASAIEDAGYVCYACAVMPDHVHLVLGRHVRPVEKIVGHLKAEATRQMDREGVHPFAGVYRPNGTRPSPWVEGYWKVFLNEDDVPRAIDYVEKNPLRAGLKPQKWSFVRAYRG